jgi:cytochrome b subunit of formate dehydrogenase
LAADAGSCDSKAAVALKVLYWLAVLAISLALLVGLILFFESRDESTLDESRAPVRGLATAVG